MKVDKSDSSKKVPKPKKLPERLGESSFPPAAVLGAFTSFVATAFNPRPEAHAQQSAPAPLVQIDFSERQNVPNPPDLEIEYALSYTLGAAGSLHPFRHSLSGIVVDSEDCVYALGDGEVRIFDPTGDFIQSHKAPAGTQCIAVGMESRIYYGLPGRVEIHDRRGSRLEGFSVGDGSRSANITAIKVCDSGILIADAAARLIHRFDLNGKQIGTIGIQGKNLRFMLPNRSLDFDVDAEGVIFAADSGRHRVSFWNTNGALLGHFGRFGLSNLQDFVGCCNPVNLAIASDGKIITAEKVIARVKVFDRSGYLLALIGPEHFDPKCTHLHLAADSKGRILAADPVRREVKIFSVLNNHKGSKNV